MNSKDNIRDGFDELLNGINNELEAENKSKTSEPRSESVGVDNIPEGSNNDEDIPLYTESASASAPAAGTDDDEDIPFESGTRVFNTVKATDSISEPVINKEGTELPQDDKKTFSESVKNDNKAKSVPADSSDMDSTHLFDKVNDTGSIDIASEKGIDKALLDEEAQIPKKGVGASFTSFLEGKKKAADIASEISAVGTQKTQPKKKKKRKKQSLGVAIVKSIAFFVLYVAFVIGASFLCAKFIFNSANDMFALMKEPAEAVIVVPKDADTGDIAKLLQKNDIIDNGFIFRVYAEFKMNKNNKKAKYEPGKYKLDSSMNYDTLLALLGEKEEVTNGTVRITFPEGSTVDDIIDLLIANGVKNSKEDYIKVINEYEFEYRFVKELDEDIMKDGRKYRLEGYLFPDTYDFYLAEKPESVINKFLANFDRKFDESYYGEIEKMGYTVDEIVTLASMVEKEAKLANDFGIVAAVFRNRLEYTKNDDFAYLDSDATLKYVLEGSKSVSAEDLRSINSPYNTYRPYRKGLPPSAICNPGLDAIVWAMYPSFNTEKVYSDGSRYNPNAYDYVERSNPVRYYFFVSDEIGSCRFAKDSASHDKNVNKIKNNMDK